MDVYGCGALPARLKGAIGAAVAVENAPGAFGARLELRGRHRDARGRGQDDPELNVAEQRRDPKSIYHLYRFLIALRKERKALSLGTYDLLSATDNLLIYRREFGIDRLAIALNLSSEPTDVCVDGHEITGRVLISSLSGRDGESVQSRIALRENEGIIIDMCD
jgi:alpha-glucosidase